MTKRSQLRFLPIIGALVLPAIFASCVSPSPSSGGKGTAEAERVCALLNGNEVDVKNVRADKGQMGAVFSEIATIHYRYHDVAVDRQGDLTYQWELRMNKKTEDGRSDRAHASLSAFTTRLPLRHANLSSYRASQDTTNLKGHIPFKDLIPYWRVVVSMPDSRKLVRERKTSSQATSDEKTSQVSIHFDSQGKAEAFRDAISAYQKAIQ